jgi:hypothetical protein
MAVQVLTAALRRKRLSLYPMQNLICGRALGIGIQNHFFAEAAWNNLIFGYEINVVYPLSGLPKSNLIGVT